MEIAKFIAAVSNIATYRHFSPLLCYVNCCTNDRQIAFKKACNL